MDPYKVLGVHPTMLFDEAHKRYRDLLKIHHPDKGGDKVIAQRINSAWDQIKNSLPKTKEEIQKFNDNNVNVRFKVHVDTSQSNNYSWEAQLFRLQIKESIPRYKYGLSKLHFRYAPKNNILNRFKNYEGINEYDFFLMLWVISKEDPGYKNWHYFGTNFNLQVIRDLKTNSLQLEDILPGLDYNIGISFNFLDEVVDHYLYVDGNGNYSLENSLREPQKNVSEKKFICNECESEQWVKNSTEKNPSLYCYVCQTNRIFSRKTY